MFLAAGANHVTTLEYNTIRNEHPKITAMKPPEFNAAFLDGTLEKFDIAATYSSIEHSGMGRYGDKLNPYGDLIVMARIWYD